jgi:hypothetical protein
LPVGLDLAFARNRHRFDGQQLAAYFGPSEAGDGADLVLFLADAVAELTHAGKLGDVVRRQLDLFSLPFEDLAERLACDFCDLALERSNACFASVVTDQIAKPRFGEDKLVPLQPMRFNLFGDEVPGRDLYLLVLV